MDSRADSTLSAEEPLRLHALRELKLLDTPPSESFDMITRMASQLFGLPIAAVSLTDSDRQWFKSRVGVDHWSIPREKAPCAQVADYGAPVIIPDMLADPHYRTSLLAENGIRYYCGAPLTTSEGYTLGAMCVLGAEPRETSPAELKSLTDLASMVMAQIELQHAFGRIDPVSRLPNRTQMIEDLRDLDRSGRGEGATYLLLIDIAETAQLREAVRALGPGYTDELVREAARKITDTLGPGRKAYHVAATQMAFVATPGVPIDLYLPYVERTLGALRSDGRWGFVTTTAVGVAPFPEASEPADALRMAYSAAQEARASDVRVSLYSDAHDRRHRRRFTLLNDFGAALESDDQLRLVYQPRVAVETGRCVGAEVLLRWTHPVLGEVPPSEFIPLIEHTVLARPTTEWVLENALPQLARWRGAGLDVQLSINLSAANLDEPDLPQRLAALLRRHGVSPHDIELELTESAMMSDSERATRSLQAISDLGVRLAIDDFGTGYSSLSYLQRLPVDVVKIDQSFVRDIETDPQKQTLVRTLTALCSQFGYQVVAEGVETPQALACVAEAGCDEAQGYVFARPEPAARFAHWLRGFGDDARAVA